jgi:hypothetical protein
VLDLDKQSDKVPGAQCGVQVLRARHLSMIDYHLSGMTNKQVGEKMGVSCQTISSFLGQSLVQHEITRRRVEIEHQVRERAVETTDLNAVRKSLELAAKDAADVHIGIIRDEDASLSARQRSAELVLDRVFGRDDMPRQAIQVSADTLQILVQSIDQSNALEQKSTSTSTNDSAPKLEFVDAG